MAIAMGSTEGTAIPGITAGTMLNRLKDYIKQPEGVKAFQDANIPYTPSLWDEFFEKWLTESVNEYTLDMDHDEEAFDKAVHEMPFDRKENYAITNMTRCLISGKEYLIYSDRITRYSNIGNKKNWHRTPLGKYPTPDIHYKLVYNHETGRGRKEIDYVLPLPTYSIPFSKEACDKLHKFAIEGVPNENENTKYLLSKGDPTVAVPRFTVYTYKDFRDGSFEDLERWGRIATPIQKQIMADEAAGKYYVPNPAQARPYS